MENHYGRIIQKERETADMTREELASLLLMPPESLAAVEREEEALSDFRLNMAANTFHISKNGLIRGERYPQMDVDEIAGMLEHISKEIGELKQMQALLEQQLYDGKERSAMKGYTGDGEISLEERYTMAMGLAGYELIPTEPDSMATVTFRNKDTGRKIGFDGWQLVGQYLEEAVPQDKAEEELPQEEKGLRM